MSDGDRSGTRGATRAWAAGAAVTALLLGGTAAAEESANDPFSIGIPGGEAPPEQVPAEERPALAATLARQGIEAYEQHRPEQAARLLERAYALGAEHSVLYPLAISLHELGQFDAAEERLRRYMAEADLDAGQRYTLQLQLRGWRRQLSRVSITTSPQGAQLLLGGQAICTTPMEEPLVLPNGEYQLEARLAGYRRLQRELVVPGGDPVELALELVPLGASSGGSRGLRIGLWTSVGLSAASAVALIVVGVLAAQQRADLWDASHPSPEDVDAAGRLNSAAYALTGSTAALGTLSIALGVVSGLRAGSGDDER